MAKLRLGVVGVGRMGNHHARILSQHAKTELVAIVDKRESTATKISRAYNTEALVDHRDLFGKVDAVCIAVPTILHYDVARDFLENGIHVLIEKPITATVEEAEKLIKLAREKELVLQVGHVERFNAAIQKFQELADTPVFIEAHRLGPFDPRVRDIGVVMDLMIHDLDIVLQMAGSPVKSVEAVGIPVLTENVDIANARLHFESGCIANLTASRLTPTQKRKIRVFQKGAYVSIDYGKPAMETFRIVPDPKAKPGQPASKIVRKNERIKKEDALTAEIDNFLDSIARGVQPQVRGEHAQDALALAVEITNMIEVNCNERAADLLSSG